MHGSGSTALVMVRMVQCSGHPLLILWHGRRAVPHHCGASCVARLELLECGDLQMFLQAHMHWAFHLHLNVKQGHQQFMKADVTPEVIYSPLQRGHDVLHGCGELNGAALLVDHVLPRGLCFSATYYCNGLTRAEPGLVTSL